MTDLAVQTTAPAAFIDEWERQPGEPPKAWKAFVIFRDMGDERGVYQVRDKAGFVANYKVLMRWADKHRWVERAAAYDRMIDRKRQRAHIEEVEAMARRQVQTGQVLQDVGLSYVKEQLDTKEKREKSMNANGALRFIDKGIDLEREGLGLDDKSATAAGDATPTVLDAQTQADVFDTIDQMAANMAEVTAMMKERSTVIDLEPEDDDIEDADLVDDESTGSGDDESG
jgi:hypothetical protein